MSKAIYKSLKAAVETAIVDVRIASGKGHQPVYVGAYLAAMNKDDDVDEWIKLLEDSNTPWKQLVKLGNYWAEDDEGTIDYYHEILNELKEGLSVGSEAVSFGD